MSSMLPAVQSIGHSIGQSLGHSLVHEVALTLPEPTAKVTIPIIIVFALLALLAMLRKLIALALIAIIIVAGFAAYQSGAFDHWVDKGKQIVNEHK